MKVKLKDTDEFKKILMLKGISQRDLAEAVEVAPAYISQIVNGARNPSSKLAKKVTDFLGLKFDEIFFISDACKS